MASDKGGVVLRMSGGEGTDKKNRLAVAGLAMPAFPSCHIQILPSPILPLPRTITTLQRNF